MPENGLEKRDDRLVLWAGARPLDIEDRLDREEPDGGIPDTALDGAREKLVVASSPFDPAEDVEASVQGGQYVVPLAEAEILSWRDRGRARGAEVDCADSRKDIEEPPDVLRRAFVDDVDVERHDWGPLRDGGDSSDDDEPDVSVGQRPEEASRVHGLS